MIIAVALPDPSKYFVEMVCVMQMKINGHVQLIVVKFGVEILFVVALKKTVQIALMTVGNASPIVVITFAKNGKIARRALGIVVLALIRPYAVMRHVMDPKPAIHAHPIAVTVHPQIQYVGMGLVMVMNRVKHAQMIVAHASHIAEMDHVNTITMRTASYAQKTVEHAPHPLNVEMEYVMVLKHVVTVRVIVGNVNRHAVMVFVAMYPKKLVRLALLTVVYVTPTVEMDFVNHRLGKIVIHALGIVDRAQPPVEMVYVKWKKHANLVLGIVDPVVEMVNVITVKIV